MSLLDSPTPSSLPCKTWGCWCSLGGWALALPTSYTRLADVSCLLELRGSGYWIGNSCRCQAEALGEAFLDSSEWEPGTLATGETP